MCWNQALIGHSFSRACHPEICIYPLANHQVRDLKYIPAKLECFELRYQDFLPESDHQMSTWSVRCLSAYSWWPGTYSKWFMITCGKAFFFLKKKSPCLLITATHPAWTPHLSLFIAAERLQQLGSSQASWDKASECHSQSKALRFSQPLIQLAPQTYPYPILFITFECCQQSLLAWEPLIWRQCPGSVGCCTS